MTTAKATTRDFGAVVSADTVRFERILPGSLDRVWSYLVDPEKRGKWLAGGAIEPRVGGVAELRFQNGTLTSEPAPDRYKKYSGLIVDRQTVTRFDPPRAL